MTHSSNRRSRYVCRLIPRLNSSSVTSGILCAFLLGLPGTESVAQTISQAIVHPSSSPGAYPTTIQPPQLFGAHANATVNTPQPVAPHVLVPTHNYQSSIANSLPELNGQRAPVRSSNVHSPALRSTSTQTAVAPLNQRPFSPPSNISPPSNHAIAGVTNQMLPEARLASSRGASRLRSTRSDFRSGASLPKSHLQDSHWSILQGRDATWNDTSRLSPYQTSAIESARNTATQFRVFAESAPPIAGNIAIVNADLADKWADVAGAYQVLSNQVEAASTKLNATAIDFQEVQAKLKEYGLTSTVGLLLRNKREQLDDWQVRDSRNLFANLELNDTQQRQLELDMIRFNGSNPAAQTSLILGDAGFDQTSPQYKRLEQQIQDLLRQRHRWIESLQQGYQDFQQKLGELDSVTTESSQLAHDYRALIDRNIIWIRSDDPLSIADLRNLDGGTAALFDSRRSADFGPTVSRKLRSAPGRGVGLLIVLMLIFVVRWRTKSWLVGIGGLHRMRKKTAESRKAAAGVLTIIVALAIPAALYWIARWLGTGPVSESTLHASAAFYAASLAALAIEVPRQLLRDLGFLDKHVDVQLPRRANAMRHLTLLGLVLVVAAYAITLLGSIDHGAWRSSISRVSFMISMLVVAWSAHRMLRPTGGFLEPLIAKFGGRVIHRIRFILYFAAILFPLVLLALSALGYGFTATELLRRAAVTLACVLIAATLWSTVKILCSHAWLHLTGSAPVVEYDQYGEVRRESVAGALAEHSLELKHQLAFLCKCALAIGAVLCVGWMWIDVFPNVRMGNPVVWTIQDTVTESTVDTAGNFVTSSFVQQKPITALHLLLAAGTLFVAFQLAKLLPAMFDALVLQRVSFDEGMEHFSLVLGRCLLFGVGCFIACKWLGIRWQAIQWLAVGLTIGLGFGLQDLVRNVFGGLVVLFEKPARLGDLVTVGNVTGRVAQQRMRTTVLSDDEGREVIVPNKNFVTEDVVNWMGAGRLSVIPIEVAVTRDERPADICRTLQELVQEQPDVLLSPAPQATLVCVGKRSQRIEICAWIEEGPEVLFFRDTLLTVVSQYLREKKLLAANQPSQPAIHEWPDESIDNGYRSNSQRTRRRTA